MNDAIKNSNSGVPSYQIAQFQGLITKLFQCCQERMQYQSECFGLPDAELRCLRLFANEWYLTPKSIAYNYDSMGVEDYREYLGSLINLDPILSDSITESGHSFMLVLHVFFANLFLWCFGGGGLTALGEETLDFRMKSSRVKVDQVHRTSPQPF
jgi:hypothetical protein